MNKMVKRVSLFFVGAALLTLGSISSVQAYENATAELRVIVTGLGQKIPGSTVTVGEETAETESNGQAIFNVEPGIYEVSVEGAHGGSATDSVRVVEDEVRLKNFELGLEGALPHGEGH